MICLVRHGEAAASWGSHPDPGLSELGHMQASAVAKELVALGMTSGITSPMQRCQETCAPFMALIGQTPETVPEVSEVATPEHVVDRVAWLQGVMAGRWDEAEEALEVWRHAMRARLLRVPDNTAIFTHFVAINAIVALLQDNPKVMVFRPHYCSITQLQSNGGVLSVHQLGSESETRVL